MPTRQHRQGRRNGPANPPSDVSALAAFHHSLIFGAETIHSMTGNTKSRAQCVAEAYKTLINRNGVPVPEWFNCDCCWNGVEPHHAETDPDETVYGPPLEVDEPGAEPEAAEVDQLDQLD